MKIQNFPNHKYFGDYYFIGLANLTIKIFKEIMIQFFQLFKDIYIVITLKNFKFDAKYCN
jgi:hypothetical protein